MRQRPGTLLILVAQVLIAVPTYGQHEVALEPFGVTYAYPGDWNPDDVKLFSSPDIRSLNANGSTFHHLAYVAGIDSTLHVNEDGSVDYEAAAADSSLQLHFFMIRVWPDANWLQQFRWNWGMMRDRGQVFTKNIVSEEELGEGDALYPFEEGVAYRIAVQSERLEIPPEHYLLYRFAKNGHLYQFLLGGGFQAGFEASLPLYEEILQSIRFQPLPPVVATSP